MFASVQTGISYVWITNLVFEDNDASQKLCSMFDAAIGAELKTRCQTQWISRHVKVSYRFHIQIQRKSPHTNV